MTASSVEAVQHMSLQLVDDVCSSVTQSLLSLAPYHNCNNNKIMLA